ncbi:FHA domain-containing protein [Aestuariicoccus sp. MJ-SS9]|uniref:FHA domain-containing protein n=1 Tax=Aestuariicoccus sp. MJ-SS9 TaxID=3079855 RepID=UPI0029067D42|nr:FHA domain-containing protein [Aestuariicoccus sp. MJ-SS9]MDU8913556.1 FHA domain-containing protein [Aestuariicoccus sp. MJ-SS9]
MVRPAASLGHRHRNAACEGVAMPSFRNIVARRRPAPPSTPVEQDAPQTGPDDEERVQNVLAEIGEQRHSRLVMPPALDETPPRWNLEAPPQTMGAEILKEAAKQSTDTTEEEADAAEPEIPAAPPRKIWDLENATAAAPAADSAVDETPDETPPLAASPDPMPALDPLILEPAIVPDPAPAPVRGGRVKTRLLGFHADAGIADAFATEKAPAVSDIINFPVGWVVIVDGPGKGRAFPVALGLSTLGRGSDQTIPIDFGDDCISRDTHASIAYDDEENKILIGHGGKSNLVRLNGKPLVSATELQTGDQFRIGKTTLRFVALCGPDFSWTDASDAE